MASVVEKKRPRKGDCWGVASLRLEVYQTEDQERRVPCVVFIAGTELCNSSAKIIGDGLSTMNVVKYSSKTLSEVWKERA